MENFIDKLDALTDEVEAAISKLIRAKGVESRFRSDKCLKVENDDFMFNLDGGRYLVEVLFDECSVEFLDNSGYSYHYSVLDIEDYLKLVDYLVEVYS